MNNKIKCQLGDYSENLGGGCDSPKHNSFIITNSLYTIQDHLVHFYDIIISCTTQCQVQMLCVKLYSGDVRNEMF